MDAAIEGYLAENYQKIRELKVSDKGEVWLASEKSGKLLIVKRIAHTGLPYKALKGKNFPLLPRILHAIEDEEETLVVEEYVHGETLLDRIGRKAYLSEQEAQNILEGLCEGLAPIHAQGVIHRDIKPSNLILQSGGIVRLIDFDAARTVKEHNGEDTTHLGTIGYAPPEQFGYGQTDARSDIYSIGVTLKKSLPTDYKGYLAKILGKCTEIDPNRRYQNLQELRRVVVFQSAWSKWGKPASVVALTAFVAAACFLPKSEIAEQPPSIEREKPTTTISTATEAKPTTEENAVKATQETPTPTVNTTSIPAETGNSQETTQQDYVPVKETPSEVADIRTTEDFLELFKNEPEKLEYWKVRQGEGAERLESMKRGELGLRTEAFIANLPDTMTQAERNRVIDEFVAEQRKILGIKKWP